MHRIIRNQLTKSEEINFVTASFGNERKEFVRTHSTAFSPMKLTHLSTNPAAAFPPINVIQ